MAMENEALIVIEEGSDVEVETDGVSCCWTVYLILFLPW